jgi:hypothetical protein
MMPKNSASSGKGAAEACVSGPRTVKVVLPMYRVTTISQLLAAVEIKEPELTL